MLFQDYLKSSKEIISAAIDDITEKKRVADFPASFHELNLLSEVESFAKRGKFLRGSLFLLTCQMLGQKLTPDHAVVAAGIELVHSGLLIQDDIIDNDRKRRGEDAVFVKYEKRGEQIGVVDKGHYGKSMAIVAADVALFTAFEVISSVKSENQAELIRYFANELYLVAVAEGVDSELGQKKKEAEMEDILAVYRYKTARYTFSMPFEMACLFANGDKKTQEALSLLGQRAGIIFQLKDDEIGFFGKESDIGKPVGSDIRENKKTLLRYFLFSKANEEDFKYLNEQFGNMDLNDDDIEKIKKLAEKYAVNDEVNKYVEENMQEVNSLVKELGIDNEYSDVLNQLLEYNIKRTA